MKKKYLMILVTVLLALALASCGSSSDTTSQDESQDSNQEQTQAAEEAIHPYAWLGFQDMPECHYLDALASNHYIKKYKEYIDGMSYVIEETDARDGINTYKDDNDRTVYSIEGKVVSINKDSKSYIEEDASDLADIAKESLESAMETGTNTSGRAFVGTGSEAVPIYSDQEGDTTEYEYYEYNYPDQEKTEGDSMIERYYLKDGDVFAIYTKTTWDDTVIASTEIIESIFEDIPDGTFDLPDLSDYEKTEL